MIKSFRHKGLKSLFETGDPSRVQAAHVRRLRSILAMLNTASVIQDMDQIGLRLHELKGDRKGTWSVTVNGNWRVTFQFRDGDALLLDYEDYH
jgi:proteic killer suppression protein